MNKNPHVYNARRATTVYGGAEGNPSQLACIMTTYLFPISLQHWICVPRWLPRYRQPNSAPLFESFRVFVPGVRVKCACCLALTKITIPYAFFGCNKHDVIERKTSF